MDWQSIIVILVPSISFMGWIYSRLDKKFEKLEKSLTEKITDVDVKLTDKIDRVDAKLSEGIREMKVDIKELRTGLNRMEGAFYSKECCMLKDERQTKKAE